MSFARERWPIASMNNYTRRGASRQGMSSLTLRGRNPGKSLSVRSGTNVILPRTAELSEIGRFRGIARGAPWAATKEDQPLEPRDFQTTTNIDLFGHIARMAVDLEVAAVMSPTHFLRNGADDPCLTIDLEGVTHLRSALDREGGMAIAIGYPLILPHTSLRDRANRTELMRALKGLPFDNLTPRRVWLKRQTAVGQKNLCRDQEPAWSRLSGPSRSYWGTGRTGCACPRCRFGHRARNWRTGSFRRTELAHLRFVGPPKSTQQVTGRRGQAAQ